MLDVPTANTGNKNFSERVLRLRLAGGRVLRPWLLRRSVRLLLDGICGAAAIMVAYGLRFDMSVPAWARNQMWFWAGLLFFVNPLVISTYGGYRSTWQYFGLRDFRLMSLRLLSFNTALLLVPLLSPGLHLMPYSIVVLDLLLVLFFSGSIRMLRRVDHEALLRLSADHRILLVGTADTLAAALRQLIPLYGTGVRGAIMEGETLSNRSILGVPILGDTSSLGTLLYEHRSTMLFLCSANLQNLPRLLQTASNLDVPVKLLPSLHDLLDDRVRVSKAVSVSALSKGQENTSIRLQSEVVACFTGKVILVTGAGGSIGSEIARQVSRAPIEKLILLDQDENSVFELLAELGVRSDVLPVIADIRDRAALRHIFKREAPHIVLHAAAYKHVPMMEANPCEAVLNNVSGTRKLAEAARDFGAERMVMISSDKAVRPSSVMGATKRLAEVVIRQIARESNGSRAIRTEFACVRFGNVLGSRGSVLPMFLKQIEQGGPITVTHEDMTRYFMTIPQAVHLVLQAATLGSQGHIYMLEMGDPVRILNLAREVIHLAGLTPDKDIEIKIVGSRPGEKLHEQLWGEDARVTPTAFKQIFQVFAEDPGTAFVALIAELEEAAANHLSDEIRPLLRRLPIDYLSERAATVDPAVAHAGVQ